MGILLISPHPHAGHDNHDNDGQNYHHHQNDHHSNEHLQKPPVLLLSFIGQPEAVRSLHWNSQSAPEQPNYDHGDQNYQYNDDDYDDDVNQRISTLHQSTHQ